MPLMQFMQLLRMAIRNVFRNQRRTWLTASVIAIGIAGMGILSSFYQGELEEMMESTIRSQTGHLRVQALGYAKEARTMPLDLALNQPSGLIRQIEQLPGVDFVAPHIRFGSMLSNGERTIALRVQAVDPAREVKLNYLNQKLVEGHYLTGGNQNNQDSQNNEILVGKKLAKDLKVKTGSTLTLISNTSQGGMNAMDLKVAGIFASGSNGLDESTVFIPLESAQTLLYMPDQVTDLTVFLKNRADADSVKQKVQALGKHEVQTWQEMNKDLMNMVGMVKSSQGIISAILFIIAIFSIVNTMTMSVTERTREIGAMMAMGTYRREIVGLFLLEGGALGTLGAAIGTLIAMPIAGYFAIHGVRVSGASSMNIGLGDVIYFGFNLSTFAGYFLLGILVTTLASAYPAWMAARLKPVKALRQL
ncbi:MAG: ABC transporter permease [Bacteroidota bacterium]